MIPKYKDGGIVKVPTGSTRSSPPYRGPVPNREGMDYTGTVNGKDSYRDFGGREYVDSDNRGSMRQTRASMDAEEAKGALRSAMRKRDIIQNSATPMPDNFTPAERKALDANDRSKAAAQAARDQRDREMDDNMKRGAENYAKSRREGRQ